MRRSASIGVMITIPVDVTSRRAPIMAISEQEAGKVRASLRLSRLRALARSRDGSAAIEFALLAIPYFIIIFAILETFIAFAAEQLVSNGVDTVSRQMRTGQITFDPARAGSLTQTQFRQAFCNEISIIIRCSATEAATPSKLYLDVQSFTNFASIPTTIPRMSSDKYSDLKTSDFKFTPGGPGSINMSFLQKLSSYSVADGSLSLKQ